VRPTRLAIGFADPSTADDLVPRMSLWDRLSVERRKRLEDGDAAMVWLRKHESIERWREVGQSACDLQAAAMEMADTNKPTGAGYNRAWKKLADHVQHIRDMPTPERTHAMWLASQWEPVNTWLCTLASNERLRLNHPSAVRRRYDLAHKVPGNDQDRPESTRVKLQDQITKLTEELDAARKLKTAGTMPPGMRAEDFASMLAERMAQKTRRRFFEAFRKAMENEERQDRIEASRKARK
jgi:hypothetical protein